MLCKKEREFETEEKKLDTKNDVKYRYTERSRQREAAELRQEMREQGEQRDKEMKFRS